MYVIVLVNVQVLKCVKGTMVQNNRPKTRKEIRKEQRKQKKQRREEYYTNRSKKQQVGKFVRHPSKLEETGKLSCTQQTNKPEKIADVSRFSLH